MKWIIRIYIILHRPPKANKYARTDGGVWCESWGSTEGQGLLKPGELPPDLRSPEIAAKVEQQWAKAMRETAKHQDVFKWFYDNAVNRVEHKTTVTRSPSGESNARYEFIAEVAEGPKS